MEAEGIPKVDARRGFQSSRGTGSDITAVVKIETWGEKGFVWVMKWCHGKQLVAFGKAIAVIVGCIRKI